MLDLIKRWWPFQAWRPLHQNEYERAMSGEISWGEALKHGPAENYRVPQIRERCKEALERGHQKAKLNHPIRSVAEERNVYKECLKEILKRTSD
ncbi:hypothetical protein [Salinibacter ruber]|uniref:Uncharacterized protein n=1 Tax=Salinibacter ruber TaxID=146919 RepID=A0AAW5P732_9BACT|nr:hypothetical protein [Salinibacter ruber]MCS4157817.1 hypothetical protein [Salinibacter ruber]